MTAPRFFAALGGVTLGCSLQVVMIERLPVLAAAGAAVAVLAILWAWAKPDPIRAITDAVLEEAHDAARRLHDDAGAAVIAAELERRREVARG